MENKSSNELMAFRRKFDIISCSGRGLLTVSLKSFRMAWNPSLRYHKLKARKRSEFNQLQLELEKVQKPSIEDKGAESGANMNIETEQPSASVKAGTHEPVHRLHDARSVEFYKKHEPQEIAMPNTPASKPSTCQKMQLRKSIRKGEPSVSTKVEIYKHINGP